MKLQITKRLLKAIGVDGNSDYLNSLLNTMFEQQSVENMINKELNEIEIRILNERYNENSKHVKSYLKLFLELYEEGKSLRMSQLPQIELEAKYKFARFCSNLPIFSLILKHMEQQPEKLKKYFPSSASLTNAIIDFYSLSLDGIDSIAKLHQYKKDRHIFIIKMRITSFLHEIGIDQILEYYISFSKNDLPTRKLKVEIANFPVTFKNALLRNFGPDLTFEQFLFFTEQDMIAMENCGQRTVNAVREIIHSYGLQFFDEYDQIPSFDINKFDEYTKLVAQKEELLARMEQERMELLELEKQIRNFDFTSNVSSEQKNNCK